MYYIMQQCYTYWSCPQWSAYMYNTKTRNFHADHDHDQHEWCWILCQVLPWRTVWFIPIITKYFNGDFNTTNHIQFYPYNDTKQYNIHTIWSTDFTACNIHSTYTSSLIYPSKNQAYSRAYCTLLPTEGTYYFILVYKRISQQMVCLTWPGEQLWYLSV